MATIATHHLANKATPLPPQLFGLSSFSREDKVKVSKTIAKVKLWGMKP